MINNFKDFKDNGKDCNFHIYISCIENSDEACCDVNASNKESFITAMSVLIQKGIEKYNLTQEDIELIVSVSKIYDVLKRRKNKN